MEEEPKKLLSFGPYRYYDFSEYVRGRLVGIPCPLSETGLKGTITVDAETNSVTVNVDCVTDSEQ